MEGAAGIERGEIEFTWKGFCSELLDSTRVICAAGVSSSLALSARILKLSAASPGAKGPGGAMVLMMGAVLSTGGVSDERGKTHDASLGCGVRSRSLGVWMGNMLGCHWLESGLQLTLHLCMCQSE